MKALPIQFTAKKRSDMVSVIVSSAFPFGEIEWRKSLPIHSRKQRQWEVKVKLSTELENVVRVQIWLGKRGR